MFTKKCITSFCIYMALLLSSISSYAQDFFQPVGTTITHYDSVQEAYWHFQNPTYYYYQNTPPLSRRYIISYYYPYPYSLYYPCYKHPVYIQTYPYPYKLYQSDFSPIIGTPR